jgi:hypothetical protein
MCYDPTPATKWDSIPLYIVTAMIIAAGACASWKVKVTLDERFCPASPEAVALPAKSHEH